MKFIEESINEVHPMNLTSFRQWPSSRQSSRWINAEKQKFLYLIIKLSASGFRLIVILRFNHSAVSSAGHSVMLIIESLDLRT